MVDVSQLDENSRGSLTAVSNVDGVSIVKLYADPVTHRLLTSAVSTANLIVGTSTITSGTNGKILFNNNGVVGEITNNFVTTDQTSHQTIGDTTDRLLKLWATDITCTNAIAGSVTGNAGTVTGLTVASGKTLTVNGNSTIGLAAIQFENAGGFICATSKTLTVNQIITLAAGADSQTFTFPASSDTIMGLGAVQSVTGKKTFDKDKLELKGTSTGVVVLSNANTSATTYTLIAPAVNDTIVALAATQTLTNKRINPRLVTTASYTTDTGTSLTIANCDQFEITAQAGALKFNNPGGTPTGGQKLTIRIKDDGTARALTYDTQFRAMGVALPSTTVISKTLYMGFIFNATDTKWDLVAVAQEA